MQHVFCMRALKGEREEVKMGPDRNRERKGTAGEGTQPASSSEERSRASAGLCQRPKRKMRWLCSSYMGSEGKLHRCLEPPECTSNGKRPGHAARRDAGRPEGRGPAAVTSSRGLGSSSHKAVGGHRALGQGRSCSWTTAASCRAVVTGKRW